MAAHIHFQTSQLQWLPHVILLSHFYHHTPERSNHLVLKFLPIESWQQFGKQIMWRTGLRTNLWNLLIPRSQGLRLNHRSSLARGQLHHRLWNIFFYIHDRNLGYLIPLINKFNHMILYLRKEIRLLLLFFKIINLFQQLNFELYPWVCFVILKCLILNHEECCWAIIP